MFPQAQVQTCIEHGAPFAGLLLLQGPQGGGGGSEDVYRAETETMAQARLAEFAEKWGSKYPPIVQSWRRGSR